MGLYEQLKKLACSISREDLRRCVLGMLEDPRMTITKVEPLVTLEKSPAAPKKHHAFEGGLLLHTYSVALLALRISEVVERVYGIRVDRDLVLAAAILHDLYKFYQYRYDEREQQFKPRKDWYLSHDYAMVAELARRQCSDDLIRIVSEVHGTVPISTIEGLVVHLADSIDARLGEYIQNRILEELKDLESLCGIKQMQLLSIAVTELGIGRAFELALWGDLSNELRRVLEARGLCTNRAGQSQ